MKTLEKNKGTILAILFFSLAILGYNLFFKSDTVLSPDWTAASVIGEELVATFEELQRVTLDRSVFSSTGYLLLTDFSIDVPIQDIGRTNPFGNIGQD